MVCKFSNLKNLLIAGIINNLILLEGINLCKIIPGIKKNQLSYLTILNGLIDNSLNSIYFLFFTWL